MLATSWLPLLAKALSTGLLVVVASIAAEVLGPFWGALVASLPVSAGPAYVFLAMRHEADFVAASALSSAVANAATGLFLIAYGIAARRTSPWRGLGAAVLAWLAACLSVQLFVWTPLSALGLNVAVYGIGFVLADSERPVPEHLSPVRRRLPDLLARGVAVALFVSLVVGVSSLVGPNATGIAAVFPISLISLIVIIRPRIGGAGSSLLAANALRPMLGFGLMLLTLHLAIGPWGTVTAFIVALLVSLGWSVGLLMLKLRYQRR